MKSKVKRAGRSTTKIAAVVVVVVILALSGVYLSTTLFKGSATTSTSSSTLSSSTSFSEKANQTIGLIPLFGNFSKMQFQTATYDLMEGNSLIEEHDLQYSVLGTSTLNSTRHTKVEFSQAGAGNYSVIAWFNPAGTVDRVDVLGVGNYTGSIVTLYTTVYLSALSVINGSEVAPLFPLLSKSSEGTTQIGDVQLRVANYTLASPSQAYNGITITYARIPGTDKSLVVFLDILTPDHMEMTYRVVSLIR